MGARNPSARVRAACGATASVLTLMAAGAAVAQSSPDRQPTTATPAGPAAKSGSVQDAIGSPHSSGAAVAEIVVTARQRAESLQTVPLAVSAFSQSALKAQRVDAGEDLVIAVPNLNFVNSNTASSFSIRGIGFQVVATAADTGIGIHENNAPLVVSRLASADFYDLERVEVLRGPQGTLYGRNATGGVINSITAKPTSRMEGSLTAEYGNYNTVRVQGFVNTPLSDDFDFRLAGTFLRNDGFQKNVVTGDDIDDRDLYSVRGTLAFHPNEKLHTYLMWEHFQENDSRTAGAKTICAADPGPTSIGGVAVTNPAARAILSRGCQRTSIYDPASQAGQPNPIGALYLLNLLVGQLGPNPSLAAPAPQGFRSVALEQDPKYDVINDIAQFGADYDVARGLTLKALTTYSRDHFRTTGSGDPLTSFATTALTPGGLYTDPQFGTGGITTDRGFYNNVAEQWSQELRLQSSFTGPLNFNAGANYLHLDRRDILLVGNRAFTAYTQATDFGGAGSYIDPSASPDGQGHNYYYGLTPYKLDSYAAFGEVYYQLTPTLRLTAGARYSVDEKQQVNYPVELFQPGVGFPSALQTQKATFSEPTGRFVVDWSPTLGFTNKTLVYASYSRGYKAGGFNLPDVVAVASAYQPEFVNAYEVGTKNTMADGRLTLNLTGFYYDYTGYQISQVVGLTASTVNVDATVKGLEFESNWQPDSHWRFNANAGYTDAEISGGTSVNVLNRTADDPTLALLRGPTSRCVASAASVAPLIALIDAGVVPPTTLLGACPSATAPAGAFASSNPAINPLAALGVVIPTSGGVPISLDGKQLPNTPKLTISVGGQYTWDLPRAWKATLRGDYYRQSHTYATIYNDFSDRFDAWSNVNLSLLLTNDAARWRVQLFAKNLLDEDAITGIQTGTDLAGLVRTRFANDPRTFGISVTKDF